MLDSGVKMLHTKGSDLKGKDPCGADDNLTECMKRQHGQDQNTTQMDKVGIHEPLSIFQNGNNGRLGTRVRWIHGRFRSMV